MKKIIIPSFLLLLFFSIGLYSQQYYFEQSSGVTVSLNSVCKNTTQVWVCGDSGTVLKSPYAIANWVRVGTGQIPASVNLVSISSNSIDTALVCGNQAGFAYVYRTVNSGANWTQVFSQPNGNLNAVWFNSSTRALICGNPVGGRWSIWKTTNAGLTWDSIGMYLPQAGSEIGYANSLTGKNNLYWFGTNNSRIYYTTNSGTNWIVKATSTQISSAVYNYYNDSLALYYGGNAASYFSTNGGTNWTIRNYPGTTNIRGFCSGVMGVDYIPYLMFAVRGDNKIYVAGWLGSDFLPEYTAPGGLYNHVACEKSILYQYYTYAVRTGGGITMFTTFRGGAVNRISSVIPEGFKLYQNYPNPFNPSTKIRFDIPYSGSRLNSVVEVRIYDELGREVAIVANESLTAGQYEADFDASKLGSGIYYYRITTGEYTETKKMVLLK